MPCEVIGFTLKPSGFFSRNPGVDLPPETNQASRECCDKPTVATEAGGCCAAKKEVIAN
jgi:primary-amine oxidase